MIRHSELTLAGRIIKAHGHAGEMALELRDASIDPEDAEFLVMEMEGIPVPFQVESVRQRGTLARLVKLKGIDSDLQASAVAGHDVWMLNRDLPEDVEVDADQGTVQPDQLVGWSMEDADTGAMIGTIQGLDARTANVLWQIRTPGGGELLVPVVDQFVISADIPRRAIQVRLPDGLISDL